MLNRIQEIINKGRKISTWLNFINVIFISIFIGLVSSYAPDVFNFTMDIKSIKLLRLIIFIISLICGVLALVSRNSIDEYVENILFNHMLEVKRNKLTLPLSKPQALSQAVDENLTKSKLAVFSFFLMIILFCIMIIVHNIDKNKKVSLEQRERKQINSLIQNTDKIVGQLKSDVIIIKDINNQILSQQDETIKKIQSLSNSISKIQLGLEKIKMQQSQQQKPQQKTTTFNSDSERVSNISRKYH